MLLRPHYIFLLLILAGLMNLQAWASVPAGDTLTLKNYGSGMHHYIPDLAGATDSVYLPRYGEMRYFNSDSLFARYAALGYDAVEMELHYYYSDILVHIPPGRREEEVKKAARTIRRLGNKTLYPEIGYMEAVTVPDSTMELKEYQLVLLREVINQARKEKNTIVELRTLYFFLNRLLTYAHYSEAFVYAQYTTDFLETMPDAVYPEIFTLWYTIGDAYYRFRDYDRAIYCLRKAVRERSLNFYDRSNLRARDVLGASYRTLGDLDESDRWYRSMLESPDSVKYRPMYDCIALAGLARNRSMRGDYAGALPLFRQALPVAVAEGDNTFASGITVGMGEAYLALDDLDSTRLMIDSTRVFMNRWAYSTKHRYRNLYPLMSKYYAARGDQSLARAYVDSAMQAAGEYEKEFNALYILRAEQQLNDAERRENAAYIRNQQLTIRWIIAGMALLLIALLVIVRLYHNKQRAYQILVEKSRLWAEEAHEIRLETSGADTEDIAVMNAVRELIEKEHIYRDPTLTLDATAQQLGLHRNQVSKAVNTTQRKNFKTFINEYRLQEAIRLLSDPAQNHLTIDQILTDCGFNNRQTFYSLFRTNTGVSPSVFRKYQG